MMLQLNVQGRTKKGFNMITTILGGYMTIFHKRQLESKPGKIVIYRGKKYEVKIGTYNNGNTKIVLTEVGGPNELIATVDISKVHGGNVAIKDYAENIGMAKVLIDAGIIEERPVCLINLIVSSVHVYRLKQ